MVKCLIRITTKVNVHLRMINHCYRDVKVRVLTLGPRLLGKAIGALPLFPSLTGSGAPSRHGVQSTSTAGLESLRDSGHSTPVRSVSNSNSFLRTHGNTAVGGNGMAEFSEDSYSPSDSMLSTPVFNEHSSDQVNVCHTNGPRNIQDDRGTELGTLDRARPLGVMSKGKGIHLEKTRPIQHSPEKERVNAFICSLAHLFLVTLALLFALLLLLIALTESELDLAFFRDIRRTPEFQQFHYEYFCPLRRWLACKLRWMGGHLINK